MEFILGTIFGSLIIISFLAMGLFFLYKQNSLKKLIKKLGTTAEDQVNADLKTWAKHTNNKFIGASVFQYNENKVFEVDSIIVTKEAVVVVEIKSINGGIKGNCNEDNWTKVLGEKRFNITNPVKQNEKHISHIIKMMGTKMPVISLIIFSNKAKFIDVSDKPGHVLIIRHADAFETLDKLTIALEPKMNYEEIKGIANKIKSYKANKKGLKLHKEITTKKEGK